jgi:hypothetical protein
MYRRLFEVALFLGLAVGTAGTLSAQQPQQSSPQPSIMNNDQDTQPPAQPAPLPANPLRPNERHAR